MKIRKVAITGGSGFIGKLLVIKHLDLGDEVHVLTRNPDKFVGFSSKLFIHKGDLMDLKILKKFVDSSDILYHCAAEIKNENLMKSVNIQGTANLISVSSHNIKHWVQLSSTGVFGQIDVGDIDETQEYNPNNEYERTKLESDFLITAASRDKKFTSVIIRPSNVFGYQMSNQSLFQLIKTIDLGLYFFIGKRGASANYIPVDNVVQALYLGATKKESIGKIYNISSWCTIEEFSKIIAEELKKNYPKFRISINAITFFAKIAQIFPKSPLTVSRVNALNSRAIYKTTKIEKELGYIPIVTTKQALMEMVKFYKMKKDEK